MLWGEIDYECAYSGNIDECAENQKQIQSYINKEAQKAAATKKAKKLMQARTSRSQKSISSSAPETTSSSSNKVSKIADALE